MYKVYVLYSHGHNKLYIGYSASLRIRLRRTLVLPIAIGTVPATTKDSSSFLMGSLFFALFFN